MDALLNQALEAQTDEAFFALLTETIHLGVVGWRNIKDAQGKPISYSRKAMNELLSDDEDKSRLRDEEVWELASNWVSAVVVSEDDLKNSESQRSTDQADSVASVASTGAA